MDRPHDRTTPGAASGAERNEAADYGVRERPAPDHPSPAEELGEAAGGLSGVVAGAAIGSLGGPVGALIGGLAGAVGGWWAGRAIGEAASRITQSDDSYYREHFDASATPLADRRYEDVRPAYMLGHLAGYNPEYAGLEFEEIEAELERGWNDQERIRLGEWPSVRGYARAGYARGSTFADRLGDLPRRIGERSDRTDRGDSRSEAPRSDPR